METKNVQILLIGLATAIAIAFGTWFYIDDEKDNANSATALKANRHNINVINRLNKLIYQLPEGDLKDSLKLTGNYYFVLYSRGERDSIRALDSLTTDSIYGKYFIDNGYQIIADTVAIKNLTFLGDTIYTTLYDTILRVDTVTVNPFPNVSKLNDSTYAIVCCVD